jgi:NDP-sugar pyrophosphorylase family protein
MVKFKHALIMAAGRGARMGPLTSCIPKPMAPLGDSTLILRGIHRIRCDIPYLHITVGYKARMLADHIIEAGISSIFHTEGKGNAWWLFNTLLAHLNEPVVVLTCDNLVNLDLKKLYQDYQNLGAPACMVVPVHPVQGLEGDYIYHTNQIVTALDRHSPSTLYCSGIQVLHPGKVNKLVEPVEDFNGVWKQLIKCRQVYCSRVVPKHWFSIDTLEALAQAEILNRDPAWSNA